MPTRVLITGGAGYIGCILVPALLDRGYEVRVLDLFGGADVSLAACCPNAAFHPVRGDARDEGTIIGLLKQADVVIPLAALVGAPLCARDQIGAVTTNRDAIKLLLKHASREQRIVYPTTNSGYGIGTGEQFCTEETPLKPISLYGTTKIEAEQAILQRGHGITLRFA